MYLLCKQQTLSRQYKKNVKSLYYENNRLFLSFHVSDDAVRARYHVGEERDEYNSKLIFVGLLEKYLATIMKRSQT